MREIVNISGRKELLFAVCRRRDEKPREIGEKTTVQGRNCAISLDVMLLFEYNIYVCSEVTNINKQRFLAELGKLLTFMYEEDRDNVLAVYAKMFDEANDEKALLQHLVSPTRQAVLVARSYNSREKKLQVSSTSREQFQLEAEENPEYLSVVEDIRRDAEAKGIFEAAAWHEREEPEQEPEPEVSKDQMSLFGEAEEEEPAAEPVNVDLEAPQETEMPDFSEAPTEEPAPEEAAPVEEVPEEEDKEKKIDDFMSEFSIVEEKAPAAAEAEPAATPEVPVTEAVPEVPAEPEQAEPADVAPAITERKARPLLLILYIIIAIPLCLAGLAVLLIPTLLCLALSVVAIVAGVMMLTAAISSFAVIADLLLIGGLALMALALGLLFLWLFVWFIGGAMVSLIRGAIDLGGKWCYKEVQA